MGTGNAWDPATREGWCGPCGAMRAPDGCVHRRAAARACTAGHADTGPAGRGRRSFGDAASEVAEAVFDHTLGALGRGVAAAVRALID